MQTNRGAVPGMLAAGLMLTFPAVATWLPVGVAYAQFNYDASCGTPQGRNECLRRAADFSDDGHTVNVVRRLLVEGADPNSTGQAGNTAVHYAAGKQHPRVLLVLLAGGGDPNRRGGFGRLPLFRAAADESLQAEAARVSTVRVLLRGGADPNAIEDQFNGDTALHVVSGAFFEGRGAELVSDLLRNGANPDRRNRNGQMPLHLAVGRGYSEIVAALVRGGADPNATNGAGQTPLDIVLGEQLMRDTGVEIVRTLLRSGADPNRKGPNGDTPLHVAATTTSTEAREFVETLLSANADPCTENARGAIPHDLASRGDIRRVLERANGFRDSNPVPTVFVDDPPRRPRGCGAGEDARGGDRKERATERAAAREEGFQRVLARVAERQRQRQDTERNADRADRADRGGRERDASGAAPVGARSGDAATVNSGGGWNAIATMPQEDRLPQTYQEELSVYGWAVDFATREQAEAAASEACARPDPRCLTGGITYAFHGTNTCGVAAVQYDVYESAAVAISHFSFPSNASAADVSDLLRDTSEELKDKVRDQIRAASNRAMVGFNGICNRQGKPFYPHYEVGDGPYGRASWRAATASRTGAGSAGR